MKIRGAFACSILMVSAVLLAAETIAQGYPAKPVRTIVPFPPGGAADIVARAITQKLAEAWGMQVIVDNRAGAGGMIGSELVARAAPDGHTLLFASSSPLSINPHIASKLPYDALRDFSPVILIGHAPNVLVVHPSVPARSVKALIALARARPDEINFASNGIGTLSHLTGELFKQHAGVKLVHVPYKGGAPAVLDTVAGHVSALFAAFPTVSGQMRAGKLKALAVTTARRIQVAPELLTVSEAGLPGFESSQWWGLYGPAGLPAGVVSRLDAEVGKILGDADVRRRLAADAAEPGGGSPGDLAAFHKADYEKWGKVVKQAGIRVE